MGMSNTANEAKTVGAALSHENANHEEGVNQFALFTAGRFPLRARHSGWEAHTFAALAPAADVAALNEYKAAEKAFFDAYYAR